MAKNGTERALVTGTSRGLGRGLALELLRSGWEVVGSARSPVDEASLGERYRHVEWDQADLGLLARRVAELAGSEPFDLVVLNAGQLGSIGEFREEDVGEAQALMTVNVWACKVIVDELARAGRLGRQLVTISSGAAVNGNRGWGAYSISKAALNMLTKIYAAELPETHCAALAPGLVDTAMQDQLCGMASDERYPSLDVLRSHRGTANMPGPAEVAPRMLAAILALPDTCESGAFVDVRALPDWNG